MRWRVTKSSEKAAIIGYWRLQIRGLRRRTGQENRTLNISAPAGGFPCSSPVNKAVRQYGPASPDTPARACRYQQTPHRHLHCAAVVPQSAGMLDNEFLHWPSLANRQCCQYASGTDFATRCGPRATHTEFLTPSRCWWRRINRQNNLRMGS